jgi:class 3 adenylate cyclase
MYDSQGVVVEIGSMAGRDNPGADANTPSCSHTIHLFPTDGFRSSYESRKPIMFTSTAVLIIFLTSIAFLIYDRLVQQRQDKVMFTAEKSCALVDSLFPATVRERMLQSSSEDQTPMTSRSCSLTPRRSVATSFDDLNTVKEIGYPGLERDDDDDAVEFFDDVGDTEDSGRGWVHSSFDDASSDYLTDSEPIADSFPETTVMFADIVGFTAWSSARDPSQVFKLLETLYNSFDMISNRRGVFKVETIGDCYVAVAGLPYPRDDHAVAMCRFARDCMERMQEVVHRLESILGEDTAYLSMRIGLHSGEVTAGVLRGEKSRFQLFGDTVNTAARMESTGVANRIQLSQDTADYLILADKGNWVSPRQEKVVAKGKGQMQTYWLESSSRRRRSIETVCRRRGALDGESHEMLAMHESIASIEILPGAVTEPKAVNSSLENENHESCDDSDENITI